MLSKDFIAFGVRGRQGCDDASDSSLIEYNGVAPKWDATPFWSDSSFQSDKCC